MEKERINTIYEPKNSYQDDLDADPRAVDPFMDASGYGRGNEFHQLDERPYDDDVELDDKLLEEGEEPDEMLDDDLREFVEDRDQDMNDDKPKLAA